MISEIIIAILAASGFYASSYFFEEPKLLHAVIFGCLFFVSGILFRRK